MPKSYDPQNKWSHEVTLQTKYVSYISAITRSLVIKPDSVVTYYQELPKVGHKPLKKVF